MIVVMKMLCSLKVKPLIALYKKMCILQFSTSGRACCNLRIFLKAQTNRFCIINTDLLMRKCSYLFLEGRNRIQLPSKSELRMHGCNNFYLL